MIKGKKISVVIPCYNEETQIYKVLDTLPETVDTAYVVDDVSTDKTVEVVKDFIKKNPESKTEVVLIELEVNSGVGAAICAGYKATLEAGHDVSVVMAGDGQMPPEQFDDIVMPVVNGDTDYAKANRLYYPDAWDIVPKKRFLGNSVLSMLTKIASGYWNIADSQTGFTAINREALELIQWDQVYKRYGYPNDVLVRLNLYNLRVMDVPVKPIYDVGEQSKLKISKVIPRMSWLIFKMFIWRLYNKYVIHNFHILVIFYFLGALLSFIGLGLFVRMIVMLFVNGYLPPVNTLGWGLCTITALQFLLFAMFFDMEDNKKLSVFRKDILQRQKREQDE